MKERKWYKLDNIGNLYASTTNKNFPNVFRYSALLTEDIDKDILQTSLDKTLEIYTNFKVNLKKGFFWYYLQETNKNPIVTIENLPICYKTYENDEDFLFRVSYYKNKINFEVSHILSDGRGSIEFFKLLVTNYIKNKYSLNNIKNTTSSSILDKSEDSFSKYYEKKKYKNEKKEKIYTYKGIKMANQTLFMDCHLSTKEILSLAHKYNTTITCFLVSVLIYSIKDELSIKDLNKTIRIDIPVDLRNYFNSTSSKNFFGLAFINYKFKSKEDSLEDIIKSVKKQFKDNINAEKISERVNQMVSYEKNLFSRFVPLFIKSLVLKIIFKLSSNMSTSCISNVGPIKFDTKVSKYINSINVLTSTNNFQFIICSYNDDLSIGISSKYKYNNIIKNFCRNFSDNNLEVKINVSEVK